MLGNKHNIGFRQFIKVLALPQEICVHHAAVISGPLSSGALVGTLNLHVDPSTGAVRCQNIQPHRPVKQIFYKHLCADIHNHQIRHFQHNPQYKLDILGITLKALCQKIIIQQAKASQPLQILPVLPVYPFCHSQICHPLSSP